MVEKIGFVDGGGSSMGVVLEVYIAFLETVCGRIPRSHRGNGWRWIDSGLWQL